MPRKKNVAKAGVAIIATEQRALVRTMGSEVVPVDAVYHDREVHPRLAGPWADEADKIAWTDRLTGYPCIILRSLNGGHLCGYVAVPPSHPLYRFTPQAMMGVGIDVHGPIFYAAECQHREVESRSVCHVSPSGRMEERLITRRGEVVFENDAARRGDDAWWFGFQCNQPYDVVPEGRAPHRSDQLLDGVTERVYRDEAYVFEECARFAAQLQAIAENRDPAASVPPRAAPLGHDPKTSRR